MGAEPSKSYYIHPSCQDELGGNGHFIAWDTFEGNGRGGGKVNSLLKRILVITVSMGMGLTCSGFETMAPVLVKSPTIKIQPIEDREPPTAPRDLSAIAGTHVQLKWDPSFDGITGLVGYNIYRDGEWIGQAKETIYTDQGVKAGEIHRYQVAALDGVGNESAKSNSVSVRVFSASSMGGMEAYSYPNPAVGGAVPVIHATGKGGDNIGVRIYDLTGRLVETGNLQAIGSTVEGRTSYEFAWTGSIASGSYFGLLQGTSSGGQVSSRIKICVVR